MPTFAEYFSRLHDVSMESLIDGKAGEEIEFTMYVQLTDVNELIKQAKRTEKHEQWRVPIETEKDRGVKMRLRLIDGIRPTQCVKIKHEGRLGCVEVESDITMDMFKAIRSSAVDGYNKTRYTIPSNIPGLEWEVDVFLCNGGAPSNWVKVDLEVKNVNDPIPMFPVPHKRVIYADDELTYSDRSMVKELWEREWQKIDHA